MPNVVCNGASFYMNASKTWLIISGSKQKNIQSSTVILPTALSKYKNLLAWNEITILPYFDILPVFIIMLIILWVCE